MLSKNSFKLPSFSSFFPSLKAMAPKHSKAVEDQPGSNAKPASSSEEEEDSSSSSSTSSSSSDTQEIPPPKKPQITTPASTAIQSHDSQVHPIPPNVKPFATKPMVETSKPKTTLASSVKTSAKRPSEPHLELGKAKRPSKKASVAIAIEEVNGEIEEDANKPLFQRVFSEEDEIALLKGMFDYLVEKGADAIADMNAFYDFIKKSIHTEVTKAQLSDKIKRLKKRFQNNQGRAFKNPSHEQKIFELSKKVWGKEGITRELELSAASVIKNVALWKSGHTLFDRRYAMVGLEEEVEKFGLDMNGGEGRTTFEKNWMKLQMDELELIFQHNELINKKIKLILKNYKSKAH